MIFIDIVNGITADNIKKLCEAGLTELFRSYKLIEKINFREKLIEWKLEKVKHKYS